MKSTNSNHFRLQKSPSFFISTTTHNSLYNTTLHTSCCIYSNKDKNFKANHNYSNGMFTLRYVVSIVTKIRILKQITTDKLAELFQERCIYSNKDKNFKANHNQISHGITRCQVASAVTKIRILKRITTSRSLNTAKRKLRLQQPSEVVYNSGNSEGSASRRKVWRW